MSKTEIVLIGDILVDVTLKTSSHPLKMRMGGIVHAARGLWCLDVPYIVGYFAPSYLDEQINQYLKQHGCVEILKLGDVIGTPNVFLIEDAKEVGDQGYEFLLREDISIIYNDNAIKDIANKGCKDYFLIGGNYSLNRIVDQIDNKLHIDIANNNFDLSYFQQLEKKFGTVFLSTSSNLFKENYKDDFIEFSSLFKKLSDTIILKENRGGSRGYNFLIDKEFSASAQTGDIVHSVGVGDVFDIFYLINQPVYGDEKSITLASWGAFEYALTTFVDDFKMNVKRMLSLDIEELMKLRGNFIPWELRKSIKIYLAAPDFDFIDTKQIDLLEQSLKYHNFSPIRPIKENGQMEKGASKQQRQKLFNKDMDLINISNILIATILYDDPGTLIEIGLSVAKGIPTLVYDPFNKASNCMLTEVPILVTSVMDNLLNEVFTIASKLIIHE